MYGLLYHAAHSTRTNSMSNEHFQILKYILTDQIHTMTGTLSRMWGLRSSMTYGDGEMWCPGAALSTLSPTNCFRLQASVFRALTMQFRARLRHLVRFISDYTM